MIEREQLKQAIAALEAQRSLLGDAVVDPMIGAAQEKLNALRQAQFAQQRKQVTVLLADVSGFTAMSETMDAEEVGNTMNALWARLDGVITAGGGLIDKHIGDAVMAIFGAPIAREDDPERAIRAALLMQQELRVWNEQGLPRLQIRIGINTGPVLLGQVGTRSEYTAMGDAVNVTNRMEQAAPLGGTLVSHATYRHVRGIFDVQALEPVLVKGKTEPVQVYVVRGVKPRAFRVPTRGVEGIETRMIGRDAELEGLQKVLFEVMDEGESRVVTVVAEAGVGKSRLLYEFENWVELLPEPVSSFKGRASRRTSDLPFFLARDLFAYRFEIMNSDRAAIAREKLEQGIVRFMGPDGVEKAHFIGHLIGLDFSESPYLRGILDDARQIHDRAFHYVAQFFSAATARSAPAAGTKNGAPAVLMLDDLQWADEGSLDLIAYLAREYRHTPLLIISLARPGLFERRPAWGEELPNHMRLTLHPLSRQDSRLLVREILRQAHQLPLDLRDLIVERAEGNPFYIEELIKMLVEDGVIVKEERRWRVELERLAGVRVPATLTGVLQARLDGLPPAEREELQRASVVGRVFWDGVVQRIAEHDGRGQREMDDMSLQSLCQRELVFKHEPSAFAGEREYTFKHALLHDVAYESVLMRQRRVYHAQVAGWLIENSGERVNEYAGQIGRHFELAGVHAQAAEWYGRAGKQAQDTYAPAAAIEHFRKALALLPAEADAEADPHTAQRIEWHAGLGLMLFWQTQFEDAAEAYEAMRTTAEQTGDAIAQARAWDRLSLVQQAQGDYRTMLESATRAEAIARRTGVPAQGALSRALYTKGLALSYLGEAQEALTLGERAVALSAGLGDHRVTADGLSLLGWAHRELGHYERAADYLEQALTLLRELGDQTGVGEILNDLGAIAISRGDFQRAAELYQDALSIAREIGHRFAELVVLSNLAEAQVGLGDHRAAETHLRQVIAMAEAVGWSDLTEVYRILAEALLGQDRMSEALAAARQALELAQETGVQGEIGNAWRALAMVLAAPRTQESVVFGDETLHAAACFEKSRATFAEAGMEGERAQTLRAWARYEMERGDKQRGARMAREAEEILGRLGVEL